MIWPDTKCVMFRAAEEWLLPDMPKDVLTVEEFFGRCWGQSEATEGHVAFGFDRLRCELCGNRSLFVSDGIGSVLHAESARPCPFCKLVAHRARSRRHLNLGALRQRFVHRQCPEGAFSAEEMAEIADDETDFLHQSDIFLGAVSEDVNATLCCWCASIIGQPTST
eukprot:3810066-Pyramimonas_sp.AAC.1